MSKLIPRKRTLKFVSKLDAIEVLLSTVEDPEYITKIRRLLNLSSIDKEHLLCRILTASFDADDTRSFRKKLESIISVYSRSHANCVKRSRCVKRNRTKVTLPQSSAPKKQRTLLDKSNPLSQREDAEIEWSDQFFVNQAEEDNQDAKSSSESHSSDEDDSDEDDSDEEEQETEEEDEEETPEDNLYCELCSVYSKRVNFSSIMKQLIALRNRLFDEPELKDHPLIVKYKNKPIYCLKHTSTSAYGAAYETEKPGMVIMRLAKDEPARKLYPKQHQHSTLNVVDYTHRESPTRSQYENDEYVPTDEEIISSDNEDSHTDSHTDSQNNSEDDGVYEIDVDGTLRIYGVPVKRVYEAQGVQYAAMYVKEYRRTRESSRTDLLAEIKERESLFEKGGVIDSTSRMTKNELRNALIDRIVQSAYTDAKEDAIKKRADALRKKLVVDDEHDELQDTPQDLEEEKAKDIARKFGPLDQNLWNSLHKQEIVRTNMLDLQGLKDETGILQTDDCVRHGISDALTGIVSKISKEHGRENYERHLRRAVCLYSTAKLYCDSKRFEMKYGTLGADEPLPPKRNAHPRACKNPAAPITIVLSDSDESSCSDSEESADTEDDTLISDRRLTAKRCEIPVVYTKGIYLRNTNVLGKT